MNKEEIVEKRKKAARRLINFAVGSVFTIAVWIFGLMVGYNLAR